MAEGEMTAAQFISSAFLPRIAVIASPEAEAICMKNNLTLVELLQPFSKLESEVHYRDPLGNQVSVRGLQLQFDDLSTSCAGSGSAAAAAVAARQLSDAVRDCCPPPDQWSNKPHSPTPWFQQWRAKLLQVLPPGEHEFHRRFIGCVLAAAVDSCTAAVDQLQRLQQQQRQLQHGTAAGTPTAAVAAPGGSCQGSWFASNTLIYYLVLSDASTDCDWSTAFDRVSSSFGAHCCHHLSINSRPAQLQLPASEPLHQPDPWLPHLQPRTTLADTLTPAPQSGTDTPAEMAELVSLPSLITEGETLSEHPLSSSAATRAASPDLQLQLSSPAAAAGLNDSTLSLPDAIPRSESAPQIMLVNRVVYPSLPSTVGSTLVTSQHHHSQLHGQCLEDADLARIRRFVSDFTVQSVLPHVERLMRSLSDVVNNRKGVSRSLLSATKRWFGGNKPTSSNSAALLNTVIYSQEAPEIQVRRLGDLAFMFGHYDLAYQAFHTAKRDFNADMAWVHFAGAVEMAALSAFLHSTAAKTFPQHYLDQAITTYLDTCRVPNYALRATLFSAECLKSRGLYSEAALQCIRLTSEHNDLRSALLLEQAAHCFLNSRSTALRKYAFHMVLAGHRFSKAGQRRHSIRCYRQAFQVYEGHGWRLAEDHIQFTLARHSLALQEYDAALSALGWLLEAAAAAQGRQSAAQQATFLKEFLQVHRRCDNASPHGPVLPLPVIHSQRTAILVTSQSDSVGDGEWRPVAGVSFDDDRQLEPSWYRLEELCRDRLGISTPTFRPTLQCMNAHTSNTQHPRVDVGERVLVRLELENPLAVCLRLTDVRLLYQFQAAADDDGAATYSPVSHPDDDATICSPVSVQTIKLCLLAANSSLQLTLSVCASAAGTLTVGGLHYGLSLQEDDSEDSEKGCSVLPADSSLPGHQLISVRGPRLNGTAEERRSRVYAADKRLQIVVVKRSCRLRACVSQLPDRLLAGQLQQLQLRVDSCGKLPVRRLLLATPTPQLLSFQESSRVQQWVSSDALVCQLPVLADDASGRLGDWRLWLHAPPTAGQLTVQLLLIGWHGEVGGAYSLLRHTARLQVVPSIDASVTAVRAATAPVRLDVRLSCDAAAICSAIRLCQVSLASPRWSLMQPSTTSPVSGVCVEKGSTVCLGYTAERSDETAADKHQQHHVSHILLPDEHQSAGTDVVGEEAAAFISRHRQLLTAEAAGARSCSAGGRPVPSSARSKKAEQERNCAALMSTAVSVDASLVLHWQAVSAAAGQSDVVCGQHHLPVQQLDVISATYNLPGPRTQRQPVAFRSATPTGVQSRPDWWPGDDVIDRLVSLQLRHRRRVAHDFQRQRLCVVSVKALLVNHSSCDLTVHLTAKTFNRRLDDVDTGCRSLPSEVLWLGRTRSLLTVPARGQMQVALSAAVTRPGLYSLGSVEVSCRRATGTDAELTVQRTRSQALLVVTDAQTTVTDAGVSH